MSALQFQDSKQHNYARFSVKDRLSNQRAGECMQIKDRRAEIENQERFLANRKHEIHCEKLNATHAPETCAARYRAAQAHPWKRQAFGGTDDLVECKDCPVGIRSLQDLRRSRTKSGRFKK